MARGGGGGKRRSYTRDANGRFASTPGGGLAAARKAARSTSKAQGTLAVRTSLKRSRSKLAAKDPADPSIRNKLSTRAQKGAVTRGNKALKAAKVSSQQKLSIGKAAGIIGKKKSAQMAKSSFLPGKTTNMSTANLFKARNSSISSRKVDLTDAGFTRRLSRAKEKLGRAKREYTARGSSIYDTAARAKVATLQTAVDTLSYARKTVRSNTVPANKIKTTDKVVIDNYNKHLAATKRQAASTPLGGRKTTAPMLTRSEKAAATRAKNKASKEAEQRQRQEQARRYG